jgi:hypothetical protein
LGEADRDPAAGNARRTERTPTTRGVPMYVGLGTLLLIIILIIIFF